MSWEFCPPGPDAIRLPMTAFGDFAGSYARLPIKDKYFRVVAVKLCQLKQQIYQCTSHHLLLNS